MEQLIDKEVDKSLLRLPQLREFFKLLTESLLVNSQLLERIRHILDHKDIYRLELVVENQRGMKLFGIPLFSEKSLLPLLDPSNFQYINGTSLKLINNNLNNLPLPDLDWAWEWDSWYVLMLNDVDDQGWIYSKLFFRSSHWKGKYYFGNFIRRRVWIRLRKKTTHDNGITS